MILVRRYFFVAILPLIGCEVGPAFRAPKPDMPAKFIEATPAISAPLSDTAWWHSFGSPELDRLMAEAAKSSPDIEAAEARIVQADAQARIAGSPLLPAVSAQITQNWQKVGSSSSTLQQLEHQTYIDSRSYGGEFNASWELDFWGKNRAAYHAAEITADAARFDRAAVWLTTSASIASTYIAALGAYDRMLIAQQNLHDETEILHAYQARLDVGTANALDLSQQEALVAGTRASLPGFISTYRQNVIALAVLTGIEPEKIALAPMSLADLHHPSVDAGLPASLLRRRPDVAESEAQLMSQNETVRENIANIYPSLTLTGGGGVSSAALSAITGPGTLAANFASSLAQTIFDNGAKFGQVKNARGRYQELAADYSKSVLQALSDVETALMQVRYSAEQERLQADAARTARRSAAIARAQMAVGTVDIVTVLNTETTLFSDEDSLAVSQINQLQALVSLYKALGGGWQAKAQIR